MRPSDLERYAGRTISSWTCIMSTVHVLFLQEVGEALGTMWAPLANSQLHDVIHNPTAGDSDEFILPVVLKDQDL